MKKILSLILTVSACVLLFACSDDSNKNTPSNTQKGEVVQIVFNGEIDEDIYEKLYTAIFYEMEAAPKLVDDTAAVTQREIVIGNTNRAISAQGYKALKRIEKENESHSAYVIYSDGSSLAFAYEDDEYGLDATLLADVNYFLENLYIAYTSATLEKGILYQGSLDPIAYQKELDQKERDKQWATLSAVAGKEVVEATKAYYAMFSDKLISWMADLYDPERGAFYFSNSGRNTEGYLPDIEATYDILSMIENSGMVDHVGGSYANLPKPFLQKMAAWVKGLQDPNGYFYHPQWGKELTDTKPNRRSRDLSYGMAIMNAGGLTPTYRTPSGIDGDYTLNDGTVVDKEGNPVQAASALTSRLITPMSVAVSHVVPTSETYVADYLRDAVSFEAYLYSLDLKGDSYVVGNKLSNQVSEIKQRDKELSGALVPIMEKWLIEFQNPKSGTWDWTSESDPSYSVYNGVNGVLKLLTLFNNLGIEYPNPIPAANTIVKALYADESKVNSVCHVYNTWFALDDLFENLIEHSKNISETNKIISEIRASLRADAPELIDLSAKKVAQFIKEDSSSSFARNESSATSQGMRVCVPHTNEGDTNATLINTFGTLNHMFSVLGWEKPSMFGKADYYTFFNIIESQGNIIKDEEPPLEPIDFESDTLNQTPGTVNLDKCNSSGDKIVIEDPTGSGKGNVLKYESKPDGHDSLFIPCQSANLTASCYIFESDLYFSTEQEGYFSRIYIDTSYTIGILIYDGIIHFIDTTTTASNRFEQDLGFTAKLEEWFNLRIEYYAGDVETVRMKVYLNGECVAVSDSFNDEGYGVPRPFYAQAKIEAFTGAEMTVLLDNLLVNKSNTVYKEESDPDGKLLVNVDHKDRDEIKYDFEESAENVLPEGWSKNENTVATLTQLNGSKALNLTGNDFSVSLPMNRRTKDAKTVMFDADITFGSADENSYLELYFYDSGIMGTGILKMWMVPTVVNGETIMMLHEASGGIKGLAIKGTEMKFGETHRLTIDYYEEKDAALIYIDGNLVAFSSADEAYANRGGTGRISLSAKNGSIDLSVDNVKLEKKFSSFDYAVKPSGDSITHRFEQGVPDGGSMTGATIIGDGNKVVSFAGGGTLRLPVNQRSVATDAMIFTASIKIPADAVSGDSVFVSFVSQDGKTIVKYAITVKESRVEIYEVTENKTYPNSIAAFNLGTEYTLTVEYYKSRDVAQILINDICMGVSSITYSQESGKLQAAYLVIESVGVKSNITIDNVIAETYNKFFVHMTGTGTNTENNAKTITFESSTTGSLPTNFSSDLRTASAALRIKEMMKKNEATKVLAFETSAGANDKLFFSATSAASTRVATIFETDMYFDMKTDTTTYEIYLSDKSGKYSYLLLISLAGGTVTVNDITGASSALVPGRIFGPTISTQVKGNEWFNLRIEYYSGDHNTVRIRTYINDQLVYVSCGYYGRSSTVYGTSPLNIIDRVVISSYGGVVGTLCLDDMSLTYQNIVPTDYPLTYVPKEAEPDLPNDEDGAEILTFESSVTGNLPGAVTKELASAGGALTVKEELRGGVSSKVMAFTTTGETGDKLYIAKTKTLSGYNAIRFSTELKFENLKTAGSLYIYFRNGTTVLNRIVLTVDAEGKIEFSDYYNSAYSFSTAEGKTGISALDWNTFSLTQYSYNGFSRLVIEFGDFKIISKNSSWSSLTPSKITSLRIDTSGASDMTLLFDDVSLTEAIIEIPDEHEHTYSSEWSSDEFKHWRDASCSENSECAEAKADLGEHSYGDDGLCVCGAKKPEEIVSTNLGYFESLGGFDYEDAATHWAWSAKNTAKIIRNSGWTSGDKITDGISDSTLSYLNFYNLGDDRIAEFNKGTTNDNPSEIYFVKQGGSGNTLVFETYIRFSSSEALALAEDKTLLTLGVINETTNAATGYGEIAIVGISGEEAVSSYMLFDTALTADVWYSLAIELNTETGVATYYIDAKAVGTTQNADIPADLGYLRATLSGNAKATNVKFNDTYFGSVGKHLTESDEYYTFNEGVIPEGITSDLRSEGASLSVTDAPSVGATEKALTLDTNAGKEDMVYFTPAAAEGAAKLVFETKYFLDITTDSNQVFEYMNGSNLAGYVLITMSSDGKLTVADYLKYNGVVNTGYFSNTTINLGTPQWIDLKLVSYEDTDSVFCTEIWINGKHIQTSKNSHWTETTVDSITSLRYRAFSALDAKVYFDDVKIAKIKE